MNPNSKTETMKSHNSILNPQWITFLAIIFCMIIMKLMPYLMKVHVVPMGIPHFLWSLSPEFALGIYCGVFYRHKTWMLFLPVAMRLFCDILLACLNREWVYLFYPSQAATYSALLLTTIFGIGAGRKFDVSQILLRSLSGAIAFFLLTNFSIWLWGDRQYYNYAYDLSGLLECYMMAIPFFRHSLFSTFLFSMILLSPLGVKVKQESAKFSLEKRRGVVGNI